MSEFKVVIEISDADRTIDKSANVHCPEEATLNDLFQLALKKLKISLNSVELEGVYWFNTKKKTYKQLMDLTAHTMRGESYKFRAKTKDNVIFKEEGGGIRILSGSLFKYFWSCGHIFGAKIMLPRCLEAPTRYIDVSGLKQL